MARILTLEKHQLSDGGYAYVKRLGWSYSFTRTYIEPNTPPDCENELTKKEAYQKLADCLKNDVCETGD
jgi:hypothetical protein